MHGSTLRKVHFHEVGAVDSIADIVGAAIGLSLLAVDRIVCSPIPTGSGFIEIEHGRVSMPAPATAELLKGIPLAPSVVSTELTTPTGAAIMATVADQFGPLPAMTISSIGWGAGDKDFREQPNLLRLIVGETADAYQQDRVWVLETNLDDISGEVIGHIARPS
ncbi:MAG: LarC family nickel insertion protein [Pirellulales bacterium]